MLSTLLALLLAAGCEFRPLMEGGNVSYVRIYLDEEILNVNTGFYNTNFYHPSYRRPEILRVALFDPESGEMKSERYLRNQGDDERGHYYDGYVIVEPGTYNLIAYNFGTESTIIANEYGWWDMTAYTNEISPSLADSFKSRGDGRAKADGEPESIRYDADHLFVAGADNIEIKHHSSLDTLRNTSGEPWFRASSIVKSYYLQIDVTGAQYLSSSSALLTGMGRSARLRDRNFTEGGEATIYFDLLTGDYTYHSQNRSCMYGTFGTFGRLPDAQNMLTVSIEMVTTYGTRLEETIPISQTFDTHEAHENQWLILHYIIEIPTPPNPPPGEGGGMMPSVGEWGDVQSDFEI
jgi:hypothetical protein